MWASENTAEGKASWVTMPKGYCLRGVAAASTEQMENGERDWAKGRGQEKIPLYGIQRRFIGRPLRCPHLWFTWESPGIHYFIGFVLALKNQKACMLETYMHSSISVLCIKTSCPIMPHFSCPTWKLAVSDTQTRCLTASWVGVGGQSNLLAIPPKLKSHKSSKLLIT